MKAKGEKLSYHNSLKKPLNGIIKYLLSESFGPERSN